MQNGDEKSFLMETEETVPLQIKFCSDEDVAEIMYIEGSKSQIKAKEQRGTRGTTPLLFGTPQHKRVNALRESPGQTPPSKRQMRGSPRLASRSQSRDRDQLYDIEEDESDDEETMKPLRPKALFSDYENEDINEACTPSFLPRKRKHAMMKKATESIQKNSPSHSSQIVTPTKLIIYSDSVTPKSKQKTPQSKQTTPTSKQVTPKSGTCNIKKVEAKTPHVQRRNIKKHLASVLEDMEGGDGDSDWEESSDSDESEESESVPSPPPTPKPLDDTPKKRGRKPKCPGTPSSTAPSPAPCGSTRSKSRTLQTTAYTSDDYFTSHATSKVVTSDHTLGKLENPRLCSNVMQDVLKRIKPKHQQEVERLLEISREKFNTWMCLLDEGFNLLLHGLGSKASVINDFYGKMLADDQDVIVINGFFTGLTLKHILKAIAEEVLGLCAVLGDDSECCDLIVEAYQRKGAEPLFLLLNNLDGPMLQGDKAQAIIARLAAVPKIRLVATIDHVNAPLLFDQQLLSKYSFVWQDVTSLLPYTDETAFENSLMVQQSGGLALASLRSVFQSLTSNAKDIFRILLQRQLDSGDTKYPGMAFSELYRECRNNFLVSSDLALRSQLTEFLDHQLVRSRRGHDASEMLLIPVLRPTLLEFSAMQAELD